jgi:flagellar motor switch protein FliN
MIIFKILLRFEHIYNNIFIANDGNQRLLTSYVTTGAYGQHSSEGKQLGNHMNDQNSLDIKAQIIESVLEIFDTMLSMDVEYSDISAPDTSNDNQMVVVIEFTGDVPGLLNIQVSAEFARAMSAAAQGSDADEIEGDEEAQNILAEIANMTAGNLKGFLMDAGLSCELSSPSFLTAPDLKIDTSSMGTHERLNFRYGDELILIDVGLTVSEIKSAANNQDVESPEPSGAETEAQEELKAVEDFDLDLILDIPIELTVELGRTRIQIDELLQLGPGSAVPLAKLENEPVDILANDTLIARGQVVVQNEKYGIKVTEITSRMERIKSLS